MEEALPCALYATSYMLWGFVFHVGASFDPPVSNPISLLMTLLPRIEPLPATVHPFQLFSTSYFCENVYVYMYSYVCAVCIVHDYVSIYLLQSMDYKYRVPYTQGSSYCSNYAMASSYPLARTGRARALTVCPMMPATRSTSARSAL